MTNESFTGAKLCIFLYVYSQYGPEPENVVSKKKKVWHLPGTIGRYSGEYCRSTRFDEQSQLDQLFWCDTRNREDLRFHENPISAIVQLYYIRYRLCAFYVENITPYRTRYFFIDNPLPASRDYYRSPRPRFAFVRGHGLQRGNKVC